MSSPRQRTSGWNTNIPIFIPIIGQFPNGIYMKRLLELEKEETQERRLHFHF